MVSSPLINWPVSFSPFPLKVKAYLDYCKVPYTIVEVNPLTKAQLAWLPEYKKVPVAVVNGVLVKDSNVIIDTINAMLMNSSEKTGVGSSGNVRYVDQDDVKLEEWRKFADGPLVQNLTVNIYRTWKEALNTFDYLTQRNFPAWSALPASYVGSTIMWLIAQKRKKQLGIGKPTSDIAQPERESLFGVLNTWTAAINSSGKPFMGGNEPDLNDLAVFGMLRSIHGLSTHADALSLPETREWYTRMEASVGQSSMLHRVGERPLE